MSSLRPARRFIGCPQRLLGCELTKPLITAISAALTFFNRRIRRDAPSFRRDEPQPRRKYTCNAKR